MTPKHARAKEAADPVKGWGPFGPNKLREHREGQGYSQQALAAAIGTSQAQIDRLEKGERKLTMEWAQKLSRPLACRWYLLFEDAPPTPPTPEEQAMLDAFKGLGEPDRRAVFRHAVSLSQSEDGPGRKEGSNGD